MAKRRKHPRRSQTGETFAQLPTEVMASEAYCAQPDYAKAILWALCAQYRGANNGNLSLVASEAKRLGVSSTWKLTAGLSLLRKAELILCTREGKYKHGRGMCALFALTWRPIDPCEHAYPPILAQRPAPN